MQELVIGSIGFVLFLILGIRFCTIDGDSDNIASALKKLGIQSNHSHSGLNAELIALGAMSLITAAVFLIDLMLLVSLTRLRDSFKAMVRA